MQFIYYDMHTGLYTKIIRSTPIVFVVFHVTFYTLNINLKIVSHLLIEYHTIIFFIRNTDHVIHNECLLGQWKLNFDSFVQDCGHSPEIFKARQILIHSILICLELSTVFVYS